MPVVHCSQLVSIAYGGSAKQDGLDGHVIQPKKLQDIAGK
jgi:heterodisulfide reductase subunit B